MHQQKVTVMRTPSLTGTSRRISGLKGDASCTWFIVWIGFCAAAKLLARGWHDKCSWTGFQLRHSYAWRGALVLLLLGGVNASFSVGGFGEYGQRGGAGALCSQQVFGVCRAELEAQRHRFLHQYCESMWFPKSCWIREVVIGLAECRFLNIPTDLRQELAEVFAALLYQGHRGDFQLPPSCASSKFARQFVSGRAKALVRHSTLLSYDGRKEVARTKHSELCRFLRTYSRRNSTQILGEEKMTEWTNDKDFTTLISETHLHLPLKVHTLMDGSETPWRIQQR